VLGGTPTILVVDVATLAVLATWPSPGGRIRGISPYRNLVYVSDMTQIYSVDWTTGVPTHFTTPSPPHTTLGGVTVDPHGVVWYGQSNYFLNDNQYFNPDADQNYTGYGGSGLPDSPSGIPNVNFSAPTTAAMMILNGPLAGNGVGPSAAVRGLAISPDGTVIYAAVDSRIIAANAAGTSSNFREVADVGSPTIIVAIGSGVVARGILAMGAAIQRPREPVGVVNVPVAGLVLGPSGSGVPSTGGPLQIGPSSVRPH
jgi:hypothetical protein